MYYFLVTVLLKLIFLGATLLTCLLLYVNWILKYWQRKKVPHLPPAIPFGNLENPFASGKSLGIQFKELYEKLKSKGLKYAGFYSFVTPTYFPIHPEYIKSVLIRDFSHFSARGFYSNEKDQPLGSNLFNIDGVKWKNLRATLTATFSSGKLKNMFQIFSDCSSAMQKCVALHALEDKPVNIKRITSYYVTDVIGNSAFGLDCNSFENPNPILFGHIKSVLTDGVNLPRVAFCNAFPTLARFLKIVLFPEHALNYFSGIINDSIAYRDANKVVRNDFLQLLINMKIGDNSNIDEITVNDIAAQGFMFFLAAYETSSSTMTFCLYELAQNQLVQQKARSEIHSVLTKYDGRITYDALMEMKYLQQVLDETLRKYPIVPFLNRKCTSDYVIPNTNIIIEKNTQVVISLLGVHRDPEFYPDPDTFDPQRFSENAKNSGHQQAYFPFGDGPRNCIGLRFGMLQTKLGVCALVKDFVFTINSKTKVPVVFDSFFVLASKEDILLNVSKCNTNEIN